mmetsp:Transcript_17968/g.63473  ORF Transcript_17968/g.63473 Transcript_17968/m.63473 type:complete len:247 (+) Transcript_17968:2134-2874(+)
MRSRRFVMSVFTIGASCQFSRCVTHIATVIWAKSGLTSSQKILTVGMKRGWPLSQCATAMRNAKTCSVVVRELSRRRTNVDAPVPTDRRWFSMRAVISVGELGSVTRLDSKVRNVVTMRPTSSTHSTSPLITHLSPTSYGCKRMTNTSDSTSVLSVEPNAKEPASTNVLAGTTKAIKFASRTIRNATTNAKKATVLHRPVMAALALRVLCMLRRSERTSSTRRSSASPSTSSVISNFCGRRDRSVS